MVSSFGAVTSENPCKGRVMRRRTLIVLFLVAAAIHYVLLTNIVFLKNYWHSLQGISRANLKVDKLITPHNTSNTTKIRHKNNLVKIVRPPASTRKFGKIASKPLCAKRPPNLGPVEVDKTNRLLEDVEKKYPEVSSGGMYTPPNCTARHKIAIIVPYRDRENHLAIFLNHMHPFLMKQQLEYGIFIIEQYGNSPFNRAKLFNVGFVESNRLKTGGWQCFFFHDVDLLPMNGRNMYSCPRQPRHMSASVDKLNYQLPYNDIFGGVSAMTYEQFTKVNGFSNKFWGWGAEDDDMAHRLKKMNYHIARYKMSIARYAMLNHRDAHPNRKRDMLLSIKKRSKYKLQKDGLMTLNYNIVEVVPHHLYTMVTVNIDEQDDL